MIFRNKDAANSSIFGDKFSPVEKIPDSIGDDLLESMRRKAWSEAPKGGESLKNSVMRSASASDDAASGGRAYIGKDSSRSIFDSMTGNEKKIDSKTAAARMREEEQGRRISLEKERRAQQNPEGEIVKKESAVHAHGDNRMSTSSRNVSIFDSKPFERMEDRAPELKKDIVKQASDLKGSRQVTSKDVFERGFGSLDESISKTTQHQSAVDKLWSSLKGK